MYITGYPSNTPLEILLNYATNIYKSALKIKSDFVKKTIPKPAFEDLLKWFSGNELDISGFVLIPFGGKMSQIGEASIPFPHRAGTLYTITYTVGWQDQSIEVAQKHINQNGAYVSPL